jgi:hypothetical protein
MAYSLPPLINGKSYEWADITINILGQPFAGVTSIEYSETQRMENIYGAGNRPVSRGYGNIEAMAKVTILMEEVEAIQAIAPLNTLQRIPEFSITVAYVDPALIPRVHTLKNCRFTNNARTVKQGDTSIAIDFDLIISHINF